LYDTATSAQLTNWVENLESRCRELIGAKKHLWFSNDVTDGDLENMMTPVSRLYKGGKFHMIRVYIDQSRQSNGYKCNFYDESETVIDADAIRADSKIIPLVEIEGVRLASRSFDVKIKLVQSMLVQDAPKNVSCMIKRTVKPGLSVIEDENAPTIKFDVSQGTPEADEEVVEEKQPIHLDITDADQSHLEEVELFPESESEDEDDEDDDEDEDDEDDGKGDESEDVNDDASKDGEAEAEEDVIVNVETSIVKDKIPELEEVDIEATEVKANCDSEDGLKEVDITSNIDQESSISLRRPDEVYFEIYKAAREKAREMRKAAMQAFLEAREIKTKYMLDDIDDSDQELEGSEV